ncbi:MAG TPA: prephenate dehydratase, partial [Pseudonocardiaceae bacterium]|nr:prephenate dehydratase [Pseudonocardiaceae bacterium]
MRIAYLGPEGTFTEQALRELPEADGADLVPADG